MKEILAYVGLKGQNDILWGFGPSLTDQLHDIPAVVIYSLVNEGIIEKATLICKESPLNTPCNYL